MLDVVAFVDEGLGHSSYAVDLGDGRALVIDPPRIPDALISTAQARGVEIALTAETHSHADYVSGSPALAQRGATLLAPKDARLEIAHEALSAGDELVLRPGIVLRAIATPGHTPDHLAYLLCEDDAPVALFSGGSLMVGTVGRTDLLGADLAEDLARHLYRALHLNVLTLPDDVAVYPTHGAGSFCSAPGASARTTTIGHERATNPLLRLDSEDAFVARAVAELGSFPTYFARLPEVNRRGLRTYEHVPALALLDVDVVRTRVANGAALVDVRPFREFGRAHIPSALSIELRPVFASWLGWLVDLDREVVFVLDDEQDRVELVRRCLSIGHDDIAGELAGGMSAWNSAISHIDVVQPGAVTGNILDVRQRAEFDVLHLPNALNIELGQLANARDAVPDGPLTVMCGHGERAMSGASILTAQGRTQVSVLAGGPEDIQ